MILASINLGVSELIELSIWHVVNTHPFHKCSVNCSCGEGPVLIHLSEGHFRALGIWVKGQARHRKTDLFIHASALWVGTALLVWVFLYLFPKRTN